MTLMEIESVIARRFSDIPDAITRNVINEIISDMNLKIEGAKVNEVCLVLENEIAGEFAGSVGLPHEPEDDKYYLCCTTGGDYVAGDLWFYDSGTAEWEEITLSGLTADDVYWCSAALAVAVWAKGEVRYYSGTAWVDTGYNWDDNYRLTLKSNFISVTFILVNDVTWDHRNYKDMDTVNECEEYYEESRFVMRFNHYFSGSGTIRIGAKVGITPVTVASTPSTVIDIPTAWISPFMNGVISRVAAYDANEIETFKIFGGMYENGLVLIKNYENNRVPFGHMRPRK